MDHKPVLWQKETSQLQPTVRKPKTIPNYISSQQNTQSNSLELNNLNAALNESVKQNNERDLEQLVANSKLSATAPEWYPRMVPENNYSNKVNITSTVQNRLNAYKVQHERVEESRENTNNENLPDFIRLRQIINTLTRDPGQFDNLLDLFMETLEPYLEDVFASPIVADIILDQAINHPNFRYTGARLCWLIEQNSPSIRAELSLKCKKRIEENPDTKNVLLLIAELYTQLPHLIVYGSLLISAFKKLISIGGNDNVKCICQALKLTGHSLEQSNKVDLDKVFSDLELLKDRVDGSASILLKSVLQLRSINWGYSSEELAESEEDNDIPYDCVENKVFYDVDGEGLTNEESEFIATHMTANDDFDSEDFDPDELFDPEPEMDEEIREAFKEFVRCSDKH